MNSRHFDIIVVGGGPAGSSCAALLAREGLDVALIDKAKFPREKICGDCVNPRCWDYFELLGVAESVRSCDLRFVTTLGISNIKGLRISAEIPCRRSRPFFAMKRSDLDTLLLRNAERCGVSVYEGTSVVEVQRKERWEVSSRGDNLEDQTFTSEILVGADGRNSLVARRLDEMYSRPRRRSRGSHDDRVGVQWYTRAQPNLGSAVEMFLFDKGYGGIVNVDQHTANVALVTSGTLARISLNELPRFLQLTLLQNPQARHICTDLEPINGIAITSPVTPAHHDSNDPRAFLVGDASRTVEPFTGEGILLALDGAATVSRKILDSYNRRKVDFPERRKTRFWVDSVFAPALRHSQIANLFLSAAIARPKLLSLAVKTVIS